MYMTAGLWDKYSDIWEVVQEEKYRNQYIMNVKTTLYFMMRL